jgi:hypothetical protein
MRGVLRELFHCYTRSFIGKKFRGITIVDAPTADVGTFGKVAGSSTTI